MIRPLVTLTTDFGTSGSYVGQLKGVLLSLAPELHVVDITHEIAPQDVHGAAYVLAEAAPRFPAGTIHVVVVDPGVGTERPLVCASCGEAWYLAPDNGVLDRVLQRYPDAWAVELRATRYWASEVSRTFHGRDILAPVAARLAQGLDPRQLGPPRDLAPRLAWAAVKRTATGGEGVIERVDTFGNLITNIARPHLEPGVADAAVVIRCGSLDALELVETYGQRSPGDVVALWGSSGQLEIAVVNGHAQRHLGLSVGTPVFWHWRRVESGPRNLAE